MAIDEADATELALTRTTGAEATPSSSDDDDANQLGVGARISGYRIERRLGAGGMGEVFEATRLADQARVALKVLGRARATHLYRFKREFRALADVEHRNLISLHELVVPEDGPTFFTMELIDGESFTTWVRGSRASDEPPNRARLERALRQLVEGLHELHAIGCVHRDLKPSNVLVDREGRVVILDFGLVSELDGLDEGVTHDGQLLGTPAYMAPEQAMAGKAGPAADLYAVGVMLFECLTGQKPFVGPAMRVMLAKQDGEVPDPKAIVAGVPSSLRELCMRLLALDPGARPSARELLAELGDPSASGSPSTSDSPTLRRLPFVGRDVELERLRDALHEVRSQRSAITMLVHGLAGSGKSALLQRFVAEVRGDERALVLAGRCLERESVPYKGVDAVVDALSVHLRKLPAVEAASLQPRHTAAMIRLFPVLADVWDHGMAVAGELDPAELRRLGLSALRELVLRLCDRRPLLVCIDDFQWADVDSVALLAALMRPPAPPSLLLILGFHDEAEPQAAVRELRDPNNLEGREVRELELGPLAEADAIELARTLLGRDVDPARAAALARRARGNPMLLTQLVFGVETSDSAAADLGQLSARRVAELDPDARRLLELVAIAGRPIARSVILDAFAFEARTLGGLGPPPGAGEGGAKGRAAQGQADPERELEALAARGLFSTSHGLRDEDGERLLELAHDRVRTAALDGLDPARLAELHLTLAAALERRGAAPETLAEHFAGAGERERAAAYTERGAIQAVETLAFARAVELYRRAIELLSGAENADDDARRRSLKIALAEQLINLGHSSEAGDVLLELAAAAEPGSAAGYRRRAVEQLARCGRIDEAIGLTRELLRELGEPMPRSTFGAVAMFVRERVRLGLRGERFERRDPDSVPVAELARVDTLLAASTGLSMHEVMLTQALGSRALRLAYDIGDPRRIGVLASYRYLVIAGTGRFRAADRLALRSRELAALADDRELHLGNDMSEAVVEWFRANLRKAKQLFGQIIARVDHEPVPDWIRSFSTIRYAELCLTLGDLAEFRRDHPRWVASARAQGNLHEVASLEGLATTVAVTYGELDQARRHLASGRAAWQPSRYTFTCMTLDLGETALLMGARELDASARLLARFHHDVHCSGIAHFATARALLQAVEARHRIAELLAAPANPELYRRASKALRPSRRARDPMRIGESLIARAALDSIAGRRDEARLGWRRAAHYCERHDLRGHLAAVQLRLSEVTRGLEAADLEARAMAYLDEQGIGDRRHFVDLQAPAHR